MNYFTSLTNITFLYIKAYQFSSLHHCIFPTHNLLIPANKLYAPQCFPIRIMIIRVTEASPLLPTGQPALSFLEGKAASTRMLHLPPEVFSFFHVVIMRGSALYSSVCRGGLLLLSLQTFPLALFCGRGIASCMSGAPFSPPWTYLHHQSTGRHRPRALHFGSVALGYIPIERWPHQDRCQSSLPVSPSHSSPNTLHRYEICAHSNAPLIASMPYLVLSALS
jgi:hypothetical protein